MRIINKTNIYGDCSSPAIQKAINQLFDFKNGHEDVIVASAIMPDAHFGYGVPIGGVFASKGMVFPSAVGFDIGCGMCAVPTTFNVEDVRKQSKGIWKDIQKAIPVGFDHHKTNQVWGGYEKIEKTVVAHEIFEKNGLRQLGTLGGGNHFIEVGADENDKVWVVIHSGSRGIGHAIATHYMKIAGGGKAKEGYYGLEVHTKDGQDYIKDLNFGLEFALENRIQMMRKVEDVMDMVCWGKFDWGGLINRNHNHAELKDTEEYGEVWIHRKGATHAEDGMMGVIPGNMLDGSFIVKGKGNPDSLYSSSHGAGRILGRRQAKETLDMGDFTDLMEGVIANVDEQRLDESPLAYKDIYQVMEEQMDLVEIVAHVKPILNVKG